MTLYEFKIKTKEDWEDVQVWHVEDYSNEQEAWEAAVMFSKQTGKEVRYNKQGSGQGNYVQANQLKKAI